MIDLQIGKAYRFEWSDPFNTYDGVYRLSAQMTYDELVASGYDLKKEIYEPVGEGLTFQTSISNIRAATILKLTNITSESDVKYIPDHLYAKIPDNSVERFQQLALAVNLGVFPDDVDMTVLLSDLTDMLEARLGTSGTVTIYTVKEMWKTGSEYEAIETARNALISDTSNLYTDKQSLLKEIVDLKTKLAYFEETYKTLNSGA